jgi:hypothetical protein
LSRIDPNGRDYIFVWGSVGERAAWDTTINVSHMEYSKCSTFAICCGGMGDYSYSYSSISAWERFYYYCINPFRYLFMQNIFHNDALTNQEVIDKIKETVT